MKYCSYCGAEMHDRAAVCLKCGCAVPAPIPQAADEEDPINGGFVLLSVLIPLFGIIYWAVQAHNRPNCAKACGVASLVSMVLSIVCSIALLL